MKQTLIVFLSFWCFAIATRAQIKGQIIPQTTAQTVGTFNTVTVFEDFNFQGPSMTLGIGNYRLVGVYGNLQSLRSLKVPIGLGVIIYELENAAGGYGRSVDFLENQSNANNNVVSVRYITIFSTVRPGYFWMRNSTVNGVFVAGHWEVNRATGNPSQTLAVVSPPLPAKAPPKTTLTQVIGPVTNVETFSIDYDESNWTNATRFQSGIFGSDFRGKDIIGIHAFERANSTGAAGNINFYYPQHRTAASADLGSSYYKHTISGTLQSSATFHNEDGFYPDSDLNINVVPSPNYQYLINEGKTPEVTALTQAGQTLGHTSNCPTAFTKVEGEIEMASSQTHMESLLQHQSGKTISLYGPWIYDKGHCQQPEIHPAEQIWYSEALNSTDRIYTCAVICDGSERFWWRKDMDVDPYFSSGPAKRKPWGAPPIKGTFAIAFEAEIGKPGKKFTPLDIESNNVATVPNGNQTYRLNYNGQTLIAFVPSTSVFKVTFEKVALMAGCCTNIVRGFLVLEATVGSVQQIATSYTDGIGTFPIPLGSDVNTVPEIAEKQCFKKVAGHYLFTIVSSSL